MESVILQYITQSYNKEIISCTHIKTGVINSNYLCQTASGEEYIFKLYNFKNADELQFEIDILLHLEQKNFPCPRLIQKNDEKLVGEVENKPCVLYKYIPGELQSTVDETFLFEVGKVLGQLHVSMQDFTPQVQKSSWDPHDIAELVEKRGNELVERNFLEAAELLSFVRVELQKYSFPDLPKGITHQDVKLENIVVQNGNIQALIDFDNSYYGALIHDLTTSIIWMCVKNEKISPVWVAALLKGYESIRPLTLTEKEVLHQAIAWRLVREIFVGPLVTLNYPDIVKQRSDSFKKIYLHFIHSESKTYGI